MRRYRTKISWRLREEVLLRDGPFCRYCGTEGAYGYLRDKHGRLRLQARLEGRPLEIDHIIPQSIGGPTVLGNLAMTCEPCNRAKGTKPPSRNLLPARPTPPPPRTTEYLVMDNCDPDPRSERWR